MADPWTSNWLRLLNQPIGKDDFLELSISATTGNIALMFPILAGKKMRESHRTKKGFGYVQTFKLFDSMHTHRALIDSFCPRCIFVIRKVPGNGVSMRIPTD
jgi:hypothetical protein